MNPPGLLLPPKHATYATFATDSHKCYISLRLRKTSYFCYFCYQYWKFHVKPATLATDKINAIINIKQKLGSLHPA